MRNGHLLLLLGLVALASCHADKAKPGMETTKEPRAADSSPPTTRTGPFHLTGPYTHENLAVYLVHGQERMPDTRCLTLTEALEHKQVIVHETSNVNELTVENVSGDCDVFIQAGDIVRGGKQDRVLAVDLILAPKSGKVPIAAFCVEQGRWSRRGAEHAHAFIISGNALGGSDMKYAVQRAGSQSAVWRDVPEKQRALNRNLDAEVRSSVSASSFELSLENDAVKESAKAYTDVLAGIVAEHPDALGYVAVINGDINIVDIYASRGLFEALWPKLLKANAVEALTRLSKDTAFEVPDNAEIEGFLVAAEDGTPRAREVSRHVRYVTRDSTVGVLFETFDTRHDTGWIHRNYIAVDESTRPNAAGERRQSPPSESGLYE